MKNFVEKKREVQLGSTCNISLKDGKVYAKKNRIEKTTIVNTNDFRNKNNGKQKYRYSIIRLMKLNEMCNERKWKNKKTML